MDEELRQQLMDAMHPDSKATLKDMAILLAAHEKKKKALGAEKKAVEAGIEELRQGMISLMTANAIDKISYEGIGSFSVKLENFASIKKADRPPAFAVLRRLEMGSLIQEQVNANTFKKWFNEEQERRTEAGEPDLKDEFGDAVSVFEKPSIRFTPPRRK